MHNCHSPPDLLGFAHICKILISVMVVVQFSWRFLSPISDREHHLKLAFEGSAYPVRLIFLKREIRNTKVRLNRYFRPLRFEGTSFDVRDIFFQIELGRFEIRNFKSQKSVSMCLSYLVENFFLVILRRTIFFVLQKFFKKNWFFGQFFVILQVVWNPVLAKPYEVLEGWFFGQWK